MLSSQVLKNKQSYSAYVGFNSYPDPESVCYSVTGDKIKLIRPLADIIHALAAPHHVTRNNVTQSLTLLPLSLAYHFTNSEF